MKAFKTISEWCFAVMAILLALQIVNVTATYTMEETCENIVKGFIADPNSCTGYGYCENGTLIQRGNCPKDFIYNSDDGTCDYPNRFNCKVANVSSICQYRTDNAIFPDPNNCAQYCVCNKKMPECNQCPKYQIFDSKTNTCVWSNGEILESTCMDHSICRLTQDKVFAGVPKECGSFTLCRKGVGTIGNCENGHKYNKKTGYCESGDFCNNSPSGGATEGQQQNITISDDFCRNKYVNGTGAQFFSDGKTCYGYVICTSANSKPIWSKCPLNTHFHKDEKKCVTPYTYACEFDRCGNLNQTFVGALSADCTNYLYCENQKSKPDSNGKYSGTKCPNANTPYFNEVTQNCENMKPTELHGNAYKLCTQPQRRA
ncbi:peritrophin-44 [Cochliomyia hominivorax]